MSVSVGACACACVCVCVCVCARYVCACVRVCGVVEFFVCGSPSVTKTGEEMTTQIEIIRASRSHVKKGSSGVLFHSPFRLRFLVCFFSVFCFRFGSIWGAFPGPFWSRFWVAFRSDLRIENLYLLGSLFASILE